jgi:hypothetical protein
MPMKILTLPLLMAAVMVTGFTDAPGRRPRDQDAVYGGLRSGQLRPLPEIESMVVPRMGGARYIGPEIIDAEHYRLKFMRGSSVIWVDVDGRTGQIISRTGD